jgi:isocitrate dehydrogenase (NAD+)
MTSSTESSQLPAALDSLRRNRVGLKGILYTGPHAESPRSLNVAIRQQLDLFASVVHCRTFSGLQSRYPNIDTVIVRENLEGEYAGLEHSAIPGVIESLKICTRKNTERTVKFAFDWAVANGRKKVTCIHKANIMKLSDGLFLKVFGEISEHYKTSHGIIANDMIVDNAAMQMVSNPSQFDTIVTSNLYGNIMANIAAGLIGSPGLVPGYNIGHEVAVFEPGARHVAKDIEGLNAANPVSMLLSSAYMLQHLGLHGHSATIRESVDRVIESNRVNH